MKLKSITSLAAAIALMGTTGAMAQTTEPAQMNGLGTWTTSPVFTIGETINGYTPVGIPDGMGAFKRGRNIEVVANHELRSTQGYPYTLANGATLTGARVSSFMLNPKTGVFENGELAYDIIYNRAGNEVFGPADLEFGGLNRLCSAGSFKKGQAGFVDDHAGTQRPLDALARRAEPAIAEEPAEERIVQEGRYAPLDHPGGVNVDHGRRQLDGLL